MLGWSLTPPSSLFWGCWFSSDPKWHQLLFSSWIRMFDLILLGFFFWAFSLLYSFYISIKLLLMFVKNFMFSESFGLPAQFSPSSQQFLTGFWFLCWSTMLAWAIIYSPYCWGWSKASVLSWFYDIPCVISYFFAWGIIRLLPLFAWLSVCNTLYSRILMISLSGISLLFWFEWGGWSLMLLLSCTDWASILT